MSLTVQQLLFTVCYMQRCREPERGGGDGRGGEGQRTQAHHQVRQFTTSPTSAELQLQVRYN